MRVIGLGLGLPFQASKGGGGAPPGDASLTLDLDFTTGTLDSKVTFTRASTATRINASGLVESVAINAARFDHDPVTLAPRGLLIEEQRINIVLQSQNFAAGNWATNLGTTKIGVAGVADPAGGSNAYEITFGTTGGAVTGASAFYQSISYVGSPAPFTASCWVRTNTGTSSIRIGTFDAGVDTGSSDIPITTTWQRISFTMNSVSASGGNVSLRANAAGNTGTVYIYGFQLEKGAFASSYISTTTAATTRSADSPLAMTGTNFSSWWNASDGTFVLEMQDEDLSANAHHINVNRTSDPTGERTAIYNFGGALYTYIANPSGIQSNVTFGTITTAPFKVALAMKLNDMGVCLNGGTVTTDASFIMSTLNRLFLGTAEDGAGSHVKQAHFRRLRFYNTRKSNAELQALTAP